MRQLLIVKSGKALNAGGATHKDLSKLEEGALLFHELEADANLAAKATKNFAIALGRANGQLPFLIPEVDLNSLQVTKATPVAGVKYKVEFTMPTPVVGSEYTLKFFKKGTVPHERNSWTVSIVAKTATASTEAEAFKKAIESKIGDKFNFSVSVATAKITISATDDTMWQVVAMDKLSGVTLTVTNGVKATGDKAYVQELASFCAAGKGFRDTLPYGHTTMPGYPEQVENTTYNVYTLRFKVGRVAAKQIDEQVWQNVYIAVPVGNTSAISSIETILGIATAA